MPIPMYEDTVKLVWENSADTPLTSSTLSKTTDYVASHIDFEDDLDGHGTILQKDLSSPLDEPDRLIMKREVIIGLINRENRVPINKQYKTFDNGLEDLYITEKDMDDSLSNPQPNKERWGANLEWFVYMCDAENELSGQILVSQSRVSPQTTQVLGYKGQTTTPIYTWKNTRIIGGFKTDAVQKIITESVWDISGMYKNVRGKKYYTLDPYSNDSEDVYGRHLYRPLRLQDLSTIGHLDVEGTVDFKSNITTKGTVKIDTAGTLVAGNNSPAGTDILGYNGYFYATKVYNARYNDIAEFFKTKDQAIPGKVYTITNDSKLKLSDKRADIRVVGVCSDSFAMVMKQEYEKEGVPIALAGTIATFVKSKVSFGDELVSDKDGFAVKANIFERIFKRSAIIGKSLEDSKDNNIKRILIIVRS